MGREEGDGSHDIKNLIGETVFNVLQLCQFLSCCCYDYFHNLLEASLSSLLLSLLSSSVGSVGYLVGLFAGST